MSNSKLISYKRISPNRNSPRNHKIDTVSIHCVVGQCSVETLGAIFAQRSKTASSNYGIGPDGRIGMYVEEKDRSWCTSSASNDNRAITIEVASDAKHPYAVTDKAYASLIKLLADICKRNNIKELKWQGNKKLIGQVSKQNMTVHRWFANKSCPGDYLYSHHGDIAKKVNALLRSEEIKKPVDKKELDVKVGDAITLKSESKYVDGKKIPTWAKNSILYVTKIQDNKVTLSTEKKGSPIGVIYKESIKTVKTSKAKKKDSNSVNYKVQVTTSALNIREKAGVNSKVVGIIKDKGIYTITKKDGNWGYLKSGKGWICLTYTKKV